MNVGEKIKKLRNEKFMTQAELSGDKITRNMLSLIEKGRATPSLQTLEYVASKLNVSIAFLLADETEENMLVKYSTISDVRLAYKSKNYRLCLDMCKRLERGMITQDDELNLIMSESALEIAKDEIYRDRIRVAWSILDEAVLYAKKTMYNTQRIKASAMIIFNYLGSLSPSLVSENMDFEELDPNYARVICCEDTLCRYIVALNDFDNHYHLDNEAYERHVECKKNMKKGEFEKAYNILNDILKLNERLPGIVLYSVFSDLEACCRQLGNSKNARTYSDEKIAQLERLLS